MFKEPYNSPQSTTESTDQYRRLIDQESAISKQRHQEDLKMAWTSMASSAGALSLGLLWLVAGLAFGKLFFYPFFMIGGGFIGLVSAIGYYHRIS